MASLRELHAAQDPSAEPGGAEQARAGTRAYDDDLTSTSQLEGSRKHRWDLVADSGFVDDELRVRGVHGREQKIAALQEQVELLIAQSGYVGRDTDGVNTMQ